MGGKDFGPSCDFPSLTIFWHWDGVENHKNGYKIACWRRKGIIGNLSAEAAYIVCGGSEARLERRRNWRCMITFCWESAII